MMRKQRVTKKNKIFVSIASYRDTQIQKTIDSCLSYADNKDSIRIVVCDQWGDGGAEVRPQPTENVEVIRVEYKHSKGCSWARNLIRKQIRDEKYYLQIDAHSLFKAGWDTYYRHMLEQLDMKENSIISNVLPPIERETDKIFESNNSKVTSANSFCDESLAVNKGETECDLPIPTKTPWIRSGFVFTYTDIINNIPHNPNMFFLGEEDELSIRLFTHGYDIYSTPKNLVGHDYSIRNTFWSDFPGPGPNGWWKFELKSRSELQNLIENKTVGKYSMGTKRTLKEFEEFAKINYKNKTII